MTERPAAGRNTLAVAATNSPSRPSRPDKNPAGLIGVFRVEFDKGEPLVVADGRELADLRQGGRRLGTSRLRRLGLGRRPGSRRLRHRPLGHDRRASRTIAGSPRGCCAASSGVEKKVRRATAYVCGLGFFDLYVNGKLVGDQLMNPALTGYDRRVCYVTFDVTPTSAGANAVGVVLGNGRYFAPRVDYPVPMHTYGYPKLLFQLRVEYADGSVETSSATRTGS